MPTGYDARSGNYNEGMTLRDYFAAAAMQGLLAADSGNDLTYEKGAEMAYMQADAMLEKRAK
jgi:hypothetical protein